MTPSWVCSASSRSVHQKWKRREKPRVLTMKCTSVSAPTIVVRVVAQSVCSWRPGSVSNRTVVRPVHSPRFG
jgi:hypothetical protein